MYSFVLVESGVVIYTSSRPPYLRTLGSVVAIDIYTAKYKEVIFWYEGGVIKDQNLYHVILG